MPLVTTNVTKYNKRNINNFGSTKMQVFKYVCYTYIKVPIFLQACETILIVSNLTNNSICPFWRHLMCVNDRSKRFIQTYKIQVCTICTLWAVLYYVVPQYLAKYLKIFCILLLNNPFCFDKLQHYIYLSWQKNPAYFGNS